MGTTFFSLTGDPNNEDWKRIWPGEKENPLQDTEKVDPGSTALPYDDLTGVPKQKMDEIIGWCKEYEREGQKMKELGLNGKTVDTNKLKYKDNKEMYKDICTVQSN